MGDTTPEITGAELVVGEGMSLFVIRQLLEGLTVRLEVDDVCREGRVSQIDVCTPEHDYVYANVTVPIPGADEDDDDVLIIRAALYTDGRVHVLQVDGEDVEPSPA